MLSTRVIRRCLAIASAVALAVIMSAAPAAAHSHHPAPATLVGVETYNLDFGGDLSLLFDPSTPLLTATSTVWAQTVASNIPERAAGVAREIGRHQPDVVGLQEVSIWRTAPAALTASGVAPTGAFTTDYDALASLIAALKAQGTPYRAIVSAKTFGNDALPLPAMTATGLRLVTFADYNVVLVREKSLRHGLRYRNAQTHTYQATLPVTVAGVSLDVTRAWAQVDITKGSAKFRFVDTHLEAFGVPPLKDQVRNPQAQELVATLATSRLPVVLVGDINARPTMCKDIPRTDPIEHVLDQNYVAYATITKAGYREVWPMLHPKAPCVPASWTSGQNSLDGAASTLTHRIDDVFLTRGISPVKVRVLGASPWDKTASGLWPSDHASTWALLRFASR